ncbi:cis-prenyltransferase 4, chloroplastic-like [Malania oleifera]|uniref:cis-prenyltransferase 4, chloroplastic-like n=1 Tax=Malania oleifera TaxID=397392 RepID=UPI0025AE065C|nr:cis-prenyltransferase 4, chloroplastic-like [Malania oleifera]XP_057982013.1 cis-prenyltransferase 4, chloroplastic-like [Malania oleifera]
MLSLHFLVPPTICNLSPRLSIASPNQQFRCPTCSVDRRVPSPSVQLPKRPRLEPTSEDLLDKRSVASAGNTAEEQILPAGLRRELLPKHVAVIMDGNRRWARLRGLPGASGHEAGLKSLRLLVELCCKWGISILTVFAFSSDNWTRPKLEVDFLMRLFERGLKKNLESFLREGVRVSVIGDSSKFPKSLQRLITDTEEATKNNSQCQLILAISYSGKYDIVQACQSIAGKVRAGLIEPKEINESLIERELETSCTKFPTADLLIRTSGELRVSNFFLWQLAYAELFFTKSFWPDFGEAEFLEALNSFQRRQRRYGGPEF